jgi:DNA processing protein
VYPREHRQLSHRIGEQGAVISDNVPNAKPDRWNFPARNRIISGLSRGVLVVEAPERSGALITVDFAADQGRDVFAVPGLATSATAVGTNRMIRDGARLVRDANDILEDLLLFATTPVLDPVQQPALFLDDDERRLLGLLTATPLHIDDIVDASGLPLPQVSAILLSLELQQHIVNTGAQHYCRR